MMVRQGQIEEETADAEFRASVFVNNPTLYQEVFEKEDEIEEIVPETPEEVQRALTELRRTMGWN